MATRGIIAVETDVGWEGRYHHWDSYPSGLGKALWDLRTKTFRNDPQRMLSVLLDEHPAGWSTIVDKDWSKEPGFIEWDSKTKDEGQPQCYCHGDRAEGEFLVTDRDDVGAEFAYVFDKRVTRMTIYVRVQGGRRAIGMFGLPTGGEWLEMAIVEFSGREPSWDRLDVE